MSFRDTNGVTDKNVGNQGQNNCKMSFFGAGF
jgi:hypothetical protein